MLLVAHQKRCGICTDTTPCGPAQAVWERLDAMADECKARGCTEDVCVMEDVS